MAPTDRTRPLVAVALLAITATLPMARLFEGAIFFTILLAVAGALGVSELSRRFNFAPIADLGLTLAALIELVSFSYLRDSLIAGIVPGPSTWNAFTELTSQGLARIQNEVAPIEASAEVLVFITIGAWLTTWLVDTSTRALGNPLLAIGAGIPILALPGTLLISDKLWIDTAPYVATSLFLLWVVANPQGARRGVRFQKVVTSGVVAGAIAALVIPVIPGFAERPLLKELGDSAVAFNPVTALRPTLNDQQVRQLFTVRATRPGYYRLTTLDTFDGQTFSQSSSSRSQRLDLSPLLLPSNSAPVRKQESSQRFSLTRLAGSWLPAQSEAREAAVPSSVNAKFEPDSGALIVVPSLPRTLEYSVRSQVPIPQAIELDELSELDSGGPLDRNRFLGIPAISEELRTITSEIVRGADNDYEKAVAIQKHLRSFTYDLDVAATHDIRSLEQFLTVVRRGYCEQFATAMAVMARIEGIPSRVVIGFGPGSTISNISRDGFRSYRVTTLDAHAWPEIWLGAAGWIAFEPTPRGGFGIIPDYTLGVRERPGVGGPTAAPTQEPETPTQRPTEEPEPSVAPTASPETPVGGGIPIRTIAVVAGSLGAIALAALALALLWRHALSRRIGGLPPGYLLFLSTCDSLGLGRRRSETPREHAVRIGTLPGVDSAPILELAERADQALFGADSGGDLLEEARAARTAVLSIIPAYRRAIARVRANLAAVARV